MTSTGEVASWVVSVSPTSDGCADLQRAFARYGRSLYRYFAVRTGDGHQAEDLMQQLWMQAQRNSTNVPADTIEYWLKAVARNLVRQHWRKRATIPLHLPIADPALAAELADRIATEDLPEECLQRREIRDQLLLAITELGSAEQELIAAYYFQDESQADLARQLSVSERAVEGRLYRARQALRQKLKHLET